MSPVQILTMVSLGLLFLAGESHSGRILFFMDLGSKSHFIAWKPLLVELSERGHDLTVVAPVPDSKLAKAKNVKFVEIDVGMMDTIDSADIFEGNRWSDPKLFIDGAIKVRGFMYSEFNGMNKFCQLGSLLTFNCETKFNL